MAHTGLQNQLNNLINSQNRLNSQADSLARDPRFSQDKQDQATRLRGQARNLQPSIDKVTNDVTTAAALLRFVCT